MTIVRQELLKGGRISGEKNCWSGENMKEMTGVKKLTELYSRHRSLKSTCLSRRSDGTRVQADNHECERLLSCRFLLPPNAMSPLIRIHTL